MEAFQFNINGLSMQSDEMTVNARRITACADALRTILNLMEPSLKNNESIYLPLRMLIDHISEAGNKVGRYHRAIDEIVDIYGVSNQRVYSDIEEITVIQAFTSFAGASTIPVSTPFQGNAILSEDWLLKMSYEDIGSVNTG